MFETEDTMLDGAQTPTFEADDGAVINLGNIGGDVITNPELDVDVNCVELDEADPYGMDEPAEAPYADEGPPPDEPGEEPPPQDEGPPPDEDPNQEPPPDGDPTPGDQGGRPFDHLTPQQYEGPYTSHLEDLLGDLRPGDGDEGDDDGPAGYEGPDRSPPEPWEAWVRDTLGAEWLERDPADLLTQVFPWLEGSELVEDVTWEDLYEYVTQTVAGGQQGSVWEMLLSFLSGH